MIMTWINRLLVIITALVFFGCVHKNADIHLFSIADTDGKIKCIGSYYLSENKKIILHGEVVVWIDDAVAYKFSFRDGKNIGGVIHNPSHGKCEFHYVFESIDRGVLLEAFKSEPLVLGVFDEKQNNKTRDR